MNKKGLLAGLAAGVLMLGMAPTAVTMAQTTGSTGTMIASGLNGPRGLSMDSSGNLYVAEAGTGGPQTVTMGDTTMMVGMTGRVTRIAPDGSKTVVADGLLSADMNGEVSGPNSVIYANGALWVTGPYMGADPAAGPSQGVLRVDMATKAVTPVADLLAYEVANNPDPNLVESNPYGLALGPDGMIYVADAAGNSLVKVDPASGQVSLVTTFAGIPLPVSPETANPGRNGANESDPVPTSLAFAPDGHAFVGFLTGFPFLEGAAKVVHVDHDGEVSDAVNGLTMVVDVEVGRNDAIYASEFGRFSLMTTPPGFQENSGRVVRSLNNGTLQVVASGLNQPNGIALDTNENVYVVVNSNSPAGTGEIWRFNSMVAPVGMPVTGESSFPVELALAALLLTAAGAGVRTFQSRRV